MSQLWFWPFWVMFLKLWLKFVDIHQSQNMNWPLADNFEATNVTFLPKKLASNVQSSCIDKSKCPKSELWHYWIKATIYSVQFMNKLIWLYNNNNYEYYKHRTSFDSFHLINLKFVWIISSNTVCKLGLTCVVQLVIHLNLQLMSCLSLN